MYNYVLSTFQGTYISICLKCRSLVCSVVDFQMSADRFSRHIIFCAQNVFFKRISALIMLLIIHVNKYVYIFIFVLYICPSILMYHAPLSLPLTGR